MTTYWVLHVVIVLVTAMVGTRSSVSQVISPITVSIVIIAVHGTFVKALLGSKELRNIFVDVVVRSCIA